MIAHAAEAGLDATPTSTRINPRTTAGQLDDLEQCGDLHTHPGAPPIPSDDDRRTWRESAERMGKPWLGIIASVRKGRPIEFRVYVTEPNGQTTKIAEPDRWRLT